MEAGVVEVGMGGGVFGVGIVVVCGWGGVGVGDEMR